MVLTHRRVPTRHIRQRSRIISLFRDGPRNCFLWIQYPVEVRKEARDLQVLKRLNVKSNNLAPPMIFNLNNAILCERVTNI